MSRHRERFGRLITCLAALTLGCNEGTKPSTTPRDVSIVAGDRQTTRRGDDLPDPLRIRVMGSDNQPYEGAVVQWAVTTGAATLTPVQSTTNSMGEAETHVTHLRTIGDITVRATVQGPAGSAASLARNFTLTGVDPCLISSMPPYVLGTVVRGRVRELDCEFSDRSLWDFYALTLTAQQTIAIRVRSDSIVPGTGIWGRQDGLNRGTEVTSLREALIKAILAPGAYAIAASSWVIGEVGPYELSTATTSASAENCEVVFVVRGIATEQHLTPTDCSGPSGGWHDIFFIALHTDERLIVTHSSTQFAPRLRLENQSGVILDVDGTATGTARIDFTSRTAAGYRLYATSTSPQQTGSYTLAISHAPTARAVASTARLNSPLNVP